MSKPGLAHDQTVEEILASIRQVISSDQARRNAVANRPAKAADAAASPPVRRPTATKPVAEEAYTVDETPSSPGTEEPDILSAVIEGKAQATSMAERTAIHSGIEQAIEQALDIGRSSEARPAPDVAERRSPRHEPAPPQVEPDEPQAAAPRPEVRGASCPPAPMLRWQHRSRTSPGRWPRVASAMSTRRSRKCCGRCSGTGSTRICRRWSSGWSARKSSGFRAARTEARARPRPD